MQAEGTLELFAELFVAFAGFTGLAGVILRSDAETSELRQELRLLLEYSLILLVFSILPLVCFHAGLSETMAWRFACAASAGQTLIYYSIRFASLRDWSSKAGTIRFFWFTLVIEWLVAALLLGAAAQPLLLPAASLYLVHLLWGLIGAALSFGRLVKPIWQSSVNVGAA